MVMAWSAASHLRMARRTSATGTCCAHMSVEAATVQKLTQHAEGHMSSTVMQLASLTSGFWCRYVRTQGFTDEQAAGKMLYAGAFATGNPSGQLLNNPFKFVVKNVANTGASSHVTMCLHGSDVGWGLAAIRARGCGQLPKMMRGQLHGTAGDVWTRLMGLSAVRRRVGMGRETVRAARERAAPRDAAGGPVYCRRDRPQWQHRGQGAVCGALPHHAPA